MTIQTAFSAVVNMSLTGSIVICIVLLARLLMKKAPKSFSYALWAVVLFRLLCPFSLSSALSLLSFTDAAVPNDSSIVSSVDYSLILDIYRGPAAPADVHPEATENVPVFYPQSTPSIPENRTEITPTPDADSQKAPAEPVREPIYYAAYIWLVGIGIMLLYNMIGLFRLRRSLIGSVHIQRNVYLADHIPSPFVLGIVKPRIYLPSSLERSVYRYILAHERYHIRRKDHIIKLLAYCALCLHWFNPLVWIAFTLSGKDMEMSCDEAVIRKYGPGIRAEYSAFLLRLATKKRIIAATPLAFGEGDTKGRVLNMAKWKKPKFWVIVCAAVLCLSIIVGCAVNPAQNDTTKDTTSIPTDPPESQPQETEQLPYLSLTGPEDACRSAIEELKNAESYYMLYEYDSAYFGDGAFTEYRRHGNDQLIHNIDPALLGDSIYYEGKKGMFYGDYWAFEDEQTDYDPNAWLSRWSIDEKEVTNLQILDEYTLSFDAVWPHQMDAANEYQGTFTYSFAPNGSLASITREYVLVIDGTASAKVDDRLTVMEESPEDTRAAIKTIADQCISISELDHYRSQKDTVTEIPSNRTEYDKSYELGAGQMGWKFLDETWRFKLGAENCTSTSAELVHCESDNDHRSLVAEEGFWLEVLKDGKWSYVDENKKSVDAPAESIQVAWDTQDRYTLDWSKSYGTLEPGFYRIGRYYTVTMDSGKTETNVCYAKFRVYNDDHNTLLYTAQLAVQTLLDSDSYHVEVIEHGAECPDPKTGSRVPAYIRRDCFRHGSDYLDISKAYNAQNDVLLDHGGSMLRSGRSYALRWINADMNSGLESWSENDFLDASTFTLWNYEIKWYDSKVEDVRSTDNSIVITQDYSFDNQYTCKEITLTFGADGHLSRVQSAYLPERGCSESDKVIDAEMIVWSDTPEDIEKLIASQDVSSPATFSYGDDKAKYPDAQLSGFVNTAPYSVQNSDDAVFLAGQECTLPAVEGMGCRYNITQVFYDTSACMWKVILSFSQHETYQAIYINDQGITQMIVTE